ncbi:MAG: hypothetical protein ACM3S0_01750 [Acidobacteriota bacterium]
MMRVTMKILRNVIPLIVVITLFSGMVYVAVQQVLRMSANDPQIAMAEDMAKALTDGQTVDALLPRAQVDIASSLSPYVVVFDDSGRAIASSGLLHDKMPTLPSGVLEYVRQNGEDRITWQPEPGVRSAVIVTRYGGARPGFVLAGRSLKEVENRVAQQEVLIGIGWFGICGVALAAVTFSEILFSRGAV